MGLGRQFQASVDELAKTEDPSNGVVETLQKICTLYGTWSIEENAQYFLGYRFYSPEEIDVISEKVGFFFYFLGREFN